LEDPWLDKFRPWRRRGLPLSALAPSSLHQIILFEAGVRACVRAGALKSSMIATMVDPLNKSLADAAMDGDHPSELSFSHIPHLA
jgi:hypothetical protein